MLRIFEFIAGGWGHSAVNAMTLKMACLAFPRRPVVFTAFDGHVQAVRSLLGGDLPPNLTFQTLPPRAGMLRWPGWRQALYFFGALQRVAARSAAREPEHWLILFGHPALVRAVRWVMALRPELTAQYQLHGELSAAFGWRSRNPLHRYFDLQATLLASRPERERWLVYEPHIRDNVCRRLGSVAPAMEVLKYQLDMAEGDRMPEIGLAAPVRFFVMGIQTGSKGYPIFQAIAEQVTQALPGRCSFHVCGIRRPELAGVSGAGLTFDIDGDRLVDRDVLLQVVADKHFAVLPYIDGAWYEFALSGVLHEAINFRKPIIALPTAAISAMFAAHGDIGHLCRTPEEMQATIRGIAEAPDPERYARQQRNLGLLRRQFSVDAVSGAYRTMTERLLGARDAQAQGAERLGPAGE